MRCSSENFHKVIDDWGYFSCPPASSRSLCAVVLAGCVYGTCEDVVVDLRYHMLEIVVLAALRCFGNPGVENEGNTFHYLGSKITI